MSIVPVLAFSAAALACSAQPPRPAPGPEPELRWYRDLAVEGVGGDEPAMHTDPDGGLWVAVPGTSDVAGRSRLFYRPAGGAWQTLYEGPFATELSLSSVRGGEVFFGYNQPLDGYRPTLFHVSEGGATPMPAPAERIDDLEHLQVGGYAMLADGSDGWACGQRGRLWRWRRGAWVPEPPVFPWRTGDPANFSYCRSISFESPEGGFMVTFDASWGARHDGDRWTLLASNGPERLEHLFPATGLARQGSALVRFAPDGWQRLPGELAAGAAPLADPLGRWAVTAEGLLAIGEAGWRALAGRLPLRMKALAEADGALWAVGPDGVYRSTQRRLPTFTPAPSGALPAGLAYLAALDLDQDGDDDLVGLSARPSDAEQGRASLVAHVNDGAGRFSARARGLPDDVLFWRDHADLGDVDGDGDFDAVVRTVRDRVELYLNDGGRFARLFSREAPGATVALVDVDGDGDLDLSLIPASPGLLLNDGAGNFAPGPEVPLPAGRVERAAWADADGDGDADAVLQRWRDPAYLLRHDGGRFELVPLAVVAEGAAWDDLDLDGLPELLAQKIHVRGVALPFVRCRVRERGACEEIPRPLVPAGLIADLNLDGRKDVLATDLRGDEAMTSDGEVHVWEEGAHQRVTDVTGLLPRPVVLDADGDGDPDVYSTSGGLFLNTAEPRSFIRIRPRASRSDRFARGAWVLARPAGGGPVVASARADFGAATLGLPDGAARYDVEVRFPAGERVVLAGASAGTDAEVKDAGPLAYRARLTLLWAKGALALAAPAREIGLPLAAIALGVVIARRRTSKALRLRVAAPLFVVAYLALAGFTLRARGLAPWLTTPAAALVTAIGLGRGRWRERRRAARRAGPYELLEKLGEGAAATVWRARAGKSQVALKLFSAESMRVSESRERFFREARIGGEIRHPNLVRIRDSGMLEDGRCYLAMELLEGRSLAALLREGGPLPTARAAGIARDVALALAALYEVDIVHRDVKPENVMVRPDGVAVLTDLGLARSALFRTLTRHDVAVGTLAYMSPEQCVGRPLDGRSDVWSLGVTLHEMLTDELPFVAEHELELVYLIHNADPPPPSSLAPAVPPALDALVLRCLARDPDDRFASAREVADALAEHGPPA